MITMKIILPATMKREKHCDKMAVEAGRKRGQRVTLLQNILVVMYELRFRITLIQTEVAREHKMHRNHNHNLL